MKRTVQTCTALALILALLLTCLPAMAETTGPEAVTIVGGIDAESAVEIDNSLLAYPLHLMHRSGNAYYTFIVPEDGTYHFSLDCYHVSICDEIGNVLASWVYNGSKKTLFILDLTAGQEIQISVWNNADYSTLTICNDTHHVSDGESYLAHPVSCCTDGQRASVCKYCTQMFGYTTIPATGHTLGDWGYYPAATCTTPGAFGQLCTDCGEVVNAVELPALGHVHSEPVVVLEPTDRQPGLMVVSCTECGETINTTVVPAVTE